MGTFEVELNSHARKSPLGQSLGSSLKGGAVSPVTSLFSFQNTLLQPSVHLQSFSFSGKKARWLFSFSEILWDGGDGGREV